MMLDYVYADILKFKHNVVDRLREFMIYIITCDVAQQAEDQHKLFSINPEPEQILFLSSEYVII